MWNSVQLRKDITADVDSRISSRSGSGTLKTMWRLLPIALAVVSATAEPGRTCEPIEIDFCKSIGYNVTGKFINQHRSNTHKAKNYDFFVS